LTRYAGPGNKESSLVLRTNSRAVAEVPCDPTQSDGFSLSEPADGVSLAHYARCTTMAKP
jgi:hypothetical protein